MNGAPSTATGTHDESPRRPRPDAIALRPKDAARALGISERALWQLTKDGAIPHVKLGRCVLYSTDALRAWLAAKSAESAKGGPIHE